MAWEFVSPEAVLFPTPVTNLPLGQAPAFWTNPLAISSREPTIGRQEYSIRHPIFGAWLKLDTGCRQQPSHPRTRGIRACLRPVCPRFCLLPSPHNAKETATSRRHFVTDNGLRPQTTDGRGLRPCACLVARRLISQFQEQLRFHLSGSEVFFVPRQWMDFSKRDGFRILNAGCGKPRWSFLLLFFRRFVSVLLVREGSMNCHSVIVRELRRMARRRSTFHHRAIVCAWAMLLLGGISVWMDWMTASAGPGTFMPPPKGAVVFGGLAVLLMFVCAIGGVGLTADCLSEERREGTLGLLFLTPLSGLDVLLGKLVSSAMAAVYWILGILPVLSLTFLMGGVAFGEFFGLS